MTHDPDPHRVHRRINWLVAIGVISFGATVAGGMTWAVARAWGL